MIDKHIVSKIYDYLRSGDSPFKIMVLPDHPTPCSIRTHTSSPVPYLIYSSDEIKRSGIDTFNEATASAHHNYKENGYELLSDLIKRI